jgi:hypothetical protein
MFPFLDKPLPETDPALAKISDSPSGLSVQLRWEGVSLPSRMATVETPAFMPGVSTFAPFLRARFQTGVGFTMKITEQTTNYRTDKTKKITRSPAMPYNQRLPKHTGL